MAKLPCPPAPPRLARRLELLVLDVDGVLTDGGLWFGPRGEALKRFHVRDGHGIKLLRAAGVEVAVISGRRSAAVARAAGNWASTYVIQGVADKNQALDQTAAKAFADRHAGGLRGR